MSEHTSHEVNPTVIYQRLRSAWLSLFIFTLLGGLLGLLASQVLPARYQANAVIEIGIDFSRTLPLNQNAEAAVSERVRALLLSDDVIKEVISAVGDSGPAPSDSEIVRFRSNLELSERESSWTLTTEDTDSALAKLIADTWADISLDAFDEAIRHAWNAVNAQDTIFELNCTVQFAQETNQAIWNCGQDGDLSVRQQQIDRLIDEARLSRGLLPGMYYSSLQSARLADMPVVWGRGALILSGIAAGFIAGLIYIIYFKESGQDQKDQSGTG